MKNYIVVISLFIFLHAIALGSPFTVLFPDGALFKIHKVEMVQEDFAVWKNNDNPLKDMFFKYNLPTSLEEYKSIFYKNGFPEGIDKLYPDWRPKMDHIIFQAQAIFFGQLDGQEVACIQYFFKQETDQIQMSFLAKRIDGKWYPVGSASMAKYQHVMAFFGTLQPGLVSCLLNPDPSSPANEAAKTLKSTCMTASQTITEACVYQMAETWGMSTDQNDLQKERQLFKSRITQATQDSRKSVIDHAMKEYIHALSVPEEGKQRAMYYFSKNENMKAIWVLRAYGLDTDNTELFGDLNRIQQTSQYRTFTYKAKENPKAN